jgi:hypothetical protein
MEPVIFRPSCRKLPTTSPAVTTNTSNTVDATVTAPTVNKRKRQVSAPTPTITVAANVSAGPAKKKCQGCIHGDLLEMTVMESCHVKHYLKPGEFLEDASCAGNCNATIKSIYGAAPKAQLHFCDEIIKGFRAPESDLGKADLECGLILCVPCHADRWVKYDQEHSSGGSTIRRSSRRGRNTFEQYAAFIKIECFGLLALSININNSGNIRNYHR